MLTSLLGLVIGGGAMFGGNALAGGDWSESIAEWSFDKASEQLPFLEDFEDTWFGDFLQNNWTMMAGGLAAYIAAPQSLKGVVGFVSIGMMIWNVLKQNNILDFNSEANPADEAAPAPVIPEHRPLVENFDPEITTRITAPHGAPEALEDPTEESAIDPAAFTPSGADATVRNMFADANAEATRIDEASARETALLLEQAQEGTTLITAADVMAARANADANAKMAFKDGILRLDRDGGIAQDAEGGFEHATDIALTLKHEGIEEDTPALDEVT